MKHAHRFMDVGLIFPFICLRDITLRWDFDDAWVAPRCRDRCWELQWSMERLMHGIRMIFDTQLMWAPAFCSSPFILFTYLGFMGFCFMCK